MSAYEIRPVNRDRLHEAFMHAFADYEMDSSGVTEDRLLLRMQKNAVDYALSPGVYVADKLVGFTLIGIDEWGGQRTAYDAGTGIVPVHRGHRLAGRMLRSALPWLEERGVTQFALEALQSNSNAIRAYQRSGFEISRELRCFKADLQTLRALEDPLSWSVRPIRFEEVLALETEADWLPSFENRFRAASFIPDAVRLLGAYRTTGTGQHVCCGAVAYCPALNWLLTLIVRRSERRRGVGRALLRALAHSIPPTVSGLAALNIDADDDGMQRFLTAVGFSHLIDQVEMRRPVGPK